MIVLFEFNNEKRADFKKHDIKRAIEQFNSARAIQQEDPNKRISARILREDYPIVFTVCFKVYGAIDYIREPIMGFPSYEAYSELRIETHLSALVFYTWIESFCGEQMEALGEWLSANYTGYINPETEELELDFWKYVVIDRWKSDTYDRFVRETKERLDNREEELQKAYEEGYEDADDNYYRNAYNEGYEQGQEDAMEDT